MDCDSAKRAALRRLTAWLVAIAASGTAVAAVSPNESAVCAKPSALSEAEKKQRRLDNYTENSPDPGKTCRGCAFFTPGAQPTACGQCAIFKGPANPKGRCDDWTSRPA
jgi:hypothetical protein